MDYPLTVLMAVYNGGPYIRTAIESILSQTFQEFRFLIVNDASTDDTEAIVRSYPDPRIEWVPLKENGGQTAALNVGLQRARTPWMARMDADDYSAPTRLESQMRALACDRSVRCVGTAIWEFSEDPKRVERVKTRPVSHDQIRRAALHGSGMIHGSIVIHRESLLHIGGYNERYRYASDRDLFIRFLSRYRATNLKEPLLGIRRYPQQDSFSKVAADEYIDIFEKLLSEEGYSPAEKRILRHSLAYSHLFRAGCLRSKGDYGGWYQEQIRAMGLSPRTWVRNLLGTLGQGLVPGRIRSYFKTDFWDREA